MDFPDIAPWGHRPLIGAANRVPLPSSRIAPKTLHTLDEWMRALGMSRGLLLDAVVAFARAGGFDMLHEAAKRKRATAASASRFARPNQKPAKPTRHVKN